MKIKVINGRFTVCKAENADEIDLNDEFVFVGKTDDEISLVCRNEKVPKNVIQREDNWRGFRIEGVLDFSLIGILSKISGILAENNISIFAVSTFNTDYIFVKEKNFEKGVNVLKECGFEVE